MLKVFWPVFASLIFCAGCAQHVSLIRQSAQLAEQNRYAEAIEMGRSALKNAEDTLGPDHPDVAVALNNLGEFQLMQAFVSQDRAAALAKAAVAAEPLHARALAIREKALGTKNSLTLASMVNLARDYGLEGRFDDAQALYLRAQGVLAEIGPRAPILVDLDSQVARGLRQIEAARIPATSR